MIVRSAALLLTICSLLSTVSAPTSPVLHGQPSRTSSQMGGYDPVIPPVPVIDLQNTLRRDLELASSSDANGGILSPETKVGVTIGVIRQGISRVFSFGIARPNSVFEIGSITKTFTGLILAQMVEQDKVRLNQSVREMLPPGTVTPAATQEVTLLDLATHHSGLPRMPDNFKHADMVNPYVDYKAEDLFAFLTKNGLQKPTGAPFRYSNLGFAVLGEALSLKSGMTYEKLLEAEITKPLGMKETELTLSPASKVHLIPGYNDGHLAIPWDFDAFAGAGSIRSTASDMLIYLEANLHPERLVADGLTSGETGTLATAINLSQQVQDDAGTNRHMRIALGWVKDLSTGDYFHDGGTGGYCSYAMFNPLEDFAIVVLVNRSIGRDANLAEVLAHHIRQRLVGSPAIHISY
jgi:serine-type D-Ala-D-Ala carboxypeptidase/endopeptidase